MAARVSRLPRSAPASLASRPVVLRAKAQAEGRLGGLGACR